MITVKEIATNNNKNGIMEKLTSTQWGTSKLVVEDECGVEGNDGSEDSGGDSDSNQVTR